MIKKQTQTQIIETVTVTVTVHVLIQQTQIQTQIRSQFRFQTHRHFINFNFNHNACFAAVMRAHLSIGESVYKCQIGAGKWQMDKHSLSQNSFFYHIIYIFLFIQFSFLFHLILI
jgi:hypothetical protein